MTLGSQAKRAHRFRRNAKKVANESQLGPPSLKKSTAWLKNRLVPAHPERTDAKLSGSERHDAQPIGSRGRLSRSARGPIAVRDRNRVSPEAGRRRDTEVMPPVVECPGRRRTTCGPRATTYH